MFGDAYVQSLFMAYIHLYLEACIMNIDLQVSKDCAFLLCCMLSKKTFLPSSFPLIQFYFQIGRFRFRILLGNKDCF